MCDIISEVTKEYADGKFDVDVRCRISGKPITHSNQFGMYCDDECNMEQDKDAEKVADRLISSALKRFGL